MNSRSQCQMFRKSTTRLIRLTFDWVGNAYLLCTTSRALHMSSPGTDPKKLATFGRMCDLFSSWFVVIKSYGSTTDTSIVLGT